MAGGFHRHDPFRQYKPRHAKTLLQRFWGYGKPKGYQGRHRNDSGMNRSHGDRYGDMT